jgi:hypothetical protein
MLLHLKDPVFPLWLMYKNTKIYVHPVVENILYCTSTLSLCFKHVR